MCDHKKFISIRKNKMSAHLVWLYFMMLEEVSGKATVMKYNCGCVRILMDEATSAMLVKNTEFLKP